MIFTQHTLSLSLPDERVDHQGSVKGGGVPACKSPRDRPPSSSSEVAGVTLAKLAISPCDLRVAALEHLASHASPITWRPASFR